MISSVVIKTSRRENCIYCKERCNILCYLLETMQLLFTLSFFLFFLFIISASTMQDKFVFYVSRLYLRNGCIRDEQLLAYCVERILFNQVILLVALGNFSAISLCIQTSRIVTSTLHSYLHHISQKFQVI